MRCEVIAVGTELLLGQVVDTNSAWIGERLALAGIDCHHQTRVGDNFGRMAACIRLALERTEAVICCGGLGPTQDDITREVIAEVMGVGLERDPAVARRIADRFAERDRPMSGNNLRQADVPAGASVTDEMPGTAPGLVCSVGDKVIYALPGVPSEMREMMNGTVLPDLRRRSGENAVIRSRVLRTWGLGESGLAELLAGRVAALDRTGNPTLAFLASGADGIKVRITAKASGEADAAAALADEEKRLREILGDRIFGVDGQTMETVVLERLRRAGRTLAVSESLTGGLAAARLSAADPDLETFVGGRVGPPLSAAATGRERAREDADGMRGAFGADVGLAAGGPAPEEEAPGAVFMGVATPAGADAIRIALPGDPAQLREYAVISLLDALRRRLEDGPEAGR